MPRPRPSMVVRLSEKIDRSVKRLASTRMPKVTSTDAPPTTPGTAPRYDRPEDEQQRRGRERERDQLGAAQVALGHVVDVLVEDRGAGERHRERGRLERLLDVQQQVARVRGVRLHRDRRVRGLVIGCDLPGLRRRRRHVVDLRQRPHLGERRLDVGLELVAAGRQRATRVGVDGVHVERARAEAVGQQLASADGLQIVGAETARREHAEDHRHRRNGDQQEHHPDGHQRPAPPTRPPAEAKEHAIGTLPERVPAGLLIGRCQDPRYRFRGQRNGRQTARLTRTGTRAHGGATPRARRRRA